MGEIVVSGDPNEELVALGLGSCIGVAAVDRAAGVAGLAHVVLPDSSGADGPAGKFADLAVLELLEQLERAGAVKRRLEVVLAGGARMFEVSGSLDIGARNEESVRDALGQAGLTVRAARTGGSQGRTLRVTVGTGHVTVRIAGESVEIILEGSATKRRSVASIAAGAIAPNPVLKTSGAQA